MTPALERREVVAVGWGVFGAGEGVRGVLGRKGLLHKEPATRMALCAAHRALGLVDGDPAAPGSVDPHTAVVVSANLGNVATVVDVVRTVRSSRWRDVSPLAAPNASSNVVASTLAIWYGFGGPNVMLCSGATGGLDAVAVASRLLRAGRARRVVVVGVEPDDEIAAGLHELRGTTGRPLRAGAASVVLALASTVDGVSLDGVRLIGPVRASADGGTVGRAGDGYGAEGVRAVVEALEGAQTGPVCCGDSVDGWRTVDVTVGGWS